MYLKVNFGITWMFLCLRLKMELFLYQQSKLYNNYYLKH
jgi:hypothetical protein